MGKKAPFVRIERIDSHPVAAVIYGMKGMRVAFTDVLECGHEFDTVIFPKPSRSPYRKAPDGSRLRRCLKCPRVGETNE